MNVRNCRKCKRLFNYVMGPYLCPACRQELEDKFQVVKKFVQDNLRADIKTVSEECDVDPMQIRQWVKEERLIFAEDSAIGVDCERCGTTIRGGRFCEKCKAEMTTGFKRATQVDKPAEPEKKTSPSGGPKMRFLE